MFLLKLIVNVHSHNDQVVGVVTLVIRVVAGVTPLTSQMIFGPSRIVVKMRGPLIVEVMEKTRASAL